MKKINSNLDKTRKYNTFSIIFDCIYYCASYLILSLRTFKAQKNLLDENF